MGLNICVECGMPTVYEKLCNKCCYVLEKCADCNTLQFYDKTWVLCKSCITAKFGKCGKCDSPATDVYHVYCVRHAD